MSFLLDPPLLIGAGAAIERYVPERRLARALESGVATVFVAGSTAIYLNAPPFEPLWRSFGEPSGRDFMWNSSVLDVEHEDRGPGVELLAAGTGPAGLSADAIPLELSLRDDGGGWKLTRAEWSRRLGRGI